MAVKTTCVFHIHVAFVHLFLVTGLFEVFCPVVAIQAIFVLEPLAYKKGGFDYLALVIGRYLRFHRALKEVEVAAVAGDLRLLEHLMGDRLLIGILFLLDRLEGQFVAEFASGPALIKLAVSKMAEVASRFENLEMPHVCLVLVAGGTIDLHSLDLIFF